MRNIIIIGNGFDLAHDLPTAYSQFINHLILSEFEKDDSDILITGSSRLLDKVLREGESRPFSVRYVSVDKKEYLFETNNYFLAGLLRSKENKEENWSDIEAFYFDELKSSKEYEIKKLQEDFEEIKLKLIVYLNFINKELKANVSFNYFFSHEYFNPRNAEHNLIMNFNYSDTLNDLYGSMMNKFRIDKVHGSLKDLDDDKIIFGHDMSFKELNENLEDNKSQEYLKNIKRVNYKTYSNFEVLRDFLNSKGEFNVFIFGHSCSISDNQVLESIFKNKLLNKIAVFYYKEINNYKAQRHNIDFIMKSTGMDIDNKIFGVNSTTIIPQFDDKNDVQSNFLGL